MNYKCLNKQGYKIKNLNLVPIRFEDRFDIMKWRNEQIHHLRQKKRLTSHIKSADIYFVFYHFNILIKMEIGVYFKKNKSNLTNMKNILIIFSSIFLILVNKGEILINFN